MLHVALATNLLLALGGHPEFDATRMIPRYPAPMTHHRPELMLNLEPCSVELVRNTFMVIEQPEVHGAVPEQDDYQTLGQFYHALELAIDHMAMSYELFSRPQRARQMTEPAFYTPVAFDVADSGGLMLIEDSATAYAAIEIIVHQGEGLSADRWADPEHRELTHFHKFKLIADGTVPLPEVRPAVTNPTTALLPEQLRPVSDLFNAIYRYSYLTLGRIFSNEPDKPVQVRRLYALMSHMMRPVARYLMEHTVGEGRVAGPSFEVYEFAGPAPGDELVALARKVARDHPQLAGVLDAIAELAAPTS